MASDEINHKLRLAELADSIRKKYNAFKYGEHDYQMKMERKYKPLIEHRQQQEQQPQPIYKNENFSKKPMESPIFVDTKFEDHIYGIKVNKNGSLMLGKFPVTVSGFTIIVNNKSYLLTKGLLSLLAHKTPSESDYTNIDLENYKDMLIQTGAHLTKRGDRLKYCQGYKYIHVIKPLFLRETDLATSQQSELQTELKNRSRILDEIEQSLSRMKKATSTPSSSSSSKFVPRKLFSVEKGEERSSSEGDSNATTSGSGFMKVIKGVKSLRGFYWNDPNELVERLLLLHAAKAAGNTNVYNEILAIEEELREANIIE